MSGLFVEKPPQAIIFDWDNTLIDSWQVIHQTLNATFDDFGLPSWTMEETKNKVRHSLRDSFPALFGDRWEEAGATYYKYFSEIHLKELHPLPGAGEMLEALNRAGIFMGVVSNKKGDFLRKEASYLGWDHLFGRLIGATDAKRDKPSPDPVFLALDGSGHSPGSGVWFAGDAGIDLECAVNSGCVPVLIREKAPEKAEFDDFPPSLHFESCQELCIRALRL
ncbi:MAG: HAD family hydrolase [Rhodospirillales bacterium]|nr:HAD family hydrolase [Rhodospirillales bacterium]